MEKSQAKLLRVGELAKAVGKTVRAMHLYEELGLLEPDARSDGGFRLYGQDAIDRINWIVKLQAIGFTLAEIQGFVADFRDAGSGRQATDRVRAVFSDKLAQIREQMTQLQVIENDLSEAIAYLVLAAWILFRGRHELPHLWQSAKEAMAGGGHGDGSGGLGDVRPIPEPGGK